MHFFVLVNLSYDLDPDDGYAGRVLLPYETYYTKDYKSSPHIQSNIEPSYLLKPTSKPINSVYHIKPKPINTFEPVPYDPYEESVNNHQHLTETTPFQPHRNLTTVTYSNLIPTTSSKPLHEMLHNMNRTSLQLLLTKLKENNYLPKTFTMNKLDNSLRTLAKVLVDLKKAQKPVKNYEYASTLPVTEYTPKIQEMKHTHEDTKSTYPLKAEGKSLNIQLNVPL